MSDSALLGKILSTSENVANRTLNCKLFHKVIEDRLIKEGISSLPTKSENNYCWLDKFLLDQPGNTRCLLENLIHYELGEISQSSLTNLESYCENLMLNSPKYFIGIVYKLIEKCFKLTFTNQAFNEFLLYDLNRVDEYYKGNLDEIQKNWIKKSKKLEKTVMEQDIKFKKIKNQYDKKNNDNKSTATSKLKKENNNELKLKSKVTILEKQIALLNGKLSDLETFNQKLIKDREKYINCSSPDTKSDAYTNHHSPIPLLYNNFYPNIKDNQSTTIQSSVSKNTSTTLASYMVDEKIAKQIKKTKVAKKESIQHKETFNLKKEKFKESKTRVLEKVKKSTMIEINNQNRQSLISDHELDHSIHKKHLRDGSKDSKDIRDDNRNQIIEVEGDLENPNIDSDHEKNTRIFNNVVIGSPVQINTNINLNTQTSGYDATSTQMKPANKKKTKTIYKAVTNHSNNPMQKIESFEDVLFQQSSTLLTCCVKNLPQNLQNKYTIRGCDLKSNKNPMNDKIIENFNSFGKNDINTLPNDEYEDLCLKKTGSVNLNPRMQDLIVANTDIMDYTNFCKILSIFIETVPKVDKRKELQVKESYFLRNLFEISLFMISKSEQVSYSTMEDMIECPKALPINFAPTTKFWKKAISNLNDTMNLKERETIRNMVDAANKKQLLFHHELNILLSNYLTRLIINTKQTLDDIRFSLLGNYSRLLDGDSNLYPKQTELKKALNTKVKALGQVFELSRQYILALLIRKKMFNISHVEITQIDNEIEDVIVADKWQQTPFILQELKLWVQNIRLI